MLSLVLFQLASTSPAQGIVHVPADAPSIQLGIALAQAGDTVVVAPGRYVGVLDFLGKAITVRSEAGPAATVIDGADGSVLPVVRFHRGEGPSSILDGFTVTGGNNAFSDSWGGGISCVLSGLNRGTPTIRNCVITGNRTWSTPGAGVAGNPLLEDCRITDNFPGSQSDGGGVWGAPTLRRCYVARNGGYWGGGIYLGHTGSSALVEDCLITENYVYEGARGGGLFVVLPGAIIRRCRIVNNRGHGQSGMTTVSGAGAYVYPGLQALFERCTIVGNEVVNGSIYTDNWGGVQGDALLVDCIVRDNDQVQVDTGASASFSNVQGGFPGTGNFDLDPLFVSAATGDYRLMAGSPCIDAADPAGALDPDGTRGDLGALPFHQANTILLNGSGVNRVGFTSVTKPVVGATWHVQIDSGSHPGVSHSAFFLVPHSLATPLVTGAGELLVDLSGPLLALRSRITSGGIDDFRLPIPPLTSLVGFHADAQAVLLGGGNELLNALDVRFGL